MTEPEQVPLTRRAVHRPRRGGMAQAAREDFSLADAVGGPRGLVEAVLPGLLFVVWFTVTHELKTSIIASVAAGVLLLLARVVTRANVTQALTGLVGLVICAVFAARTGDASNFYLPGLLINIGYAAVYALSTLRFPRIWKVPAWGPYPVIGLLIGPLVGEGLAWRSDPRRLRAYRLVTWMWVAMFVVRLAVQLPLYAADAVTALGAARLVMGVPLFGLTVWLSWLVLRGVPTATAASQDTDADAPQDDTETAQLDRADAGQSAEEQHVR